MSDRKKWKLAYSFNVDKYSEKNLKRLADAGITEIELCDANYVPYFKMGFADDPEGVVSAFARYGINIRSIHLPFCPMVMMDPSNSDEECHYVALTMQKTLIRAAGKAGIKYAVIHPSIEPYKDEERKDRLAQACAFLKDLALYAKECDVILAVENLPRSCLCRTSDEMLCLLDNIPDLRVCFDTNHSLIEDNIHYIKAVGSKIVTLHVSDYDFVDEKHWLPGEGKIDWDELLGVLEEIDYNGRFLYEVKSCYSFESVAENYRNLLELYRAN